MTPCEKSEKGIHDLPLVPPYFVGPINRNSHHVLMYEAKFSAWSRWQDRDKLEGLAYPGVYAICHTDKQLAGHKFSWRRDIIYIGMTNAASGLKSRLRQFDNTIIGKRGHGGADRVRYKYPNYNRLKKRLFASVAPFPCDVMAPRPQDLKAMGEVAKFEYSCFAHFVERFGELPEFNNKKESPKYSRMRGRK